MIHGKYKKERLCSASAENNIKIGYFYGMFLNQLEQKVEPKDMKFYLKKDLH